jgi:hypothetical protein
VRPAPKRAGWSGSRIYYLCVHEDDWLQLPFSDRRVPMWLAAITVASAFGVVVALAVVIVVKLAVGSPHNDPSFLWGERQYEQLDDSGAKAATSINYACQIAVKRARNKPAWVDDQKALAGCVYEGYRDNG